MWASSWGAYAQPEPHYQQPDPMWQQQYPTYPPPSPQPPSAAPMQPHPSERASLAEGGYADFNGVWQLNHQLSDNADEFLRTMGRSWFERKVFHNVRIREHITHNDRWLRVYVESSVKSRHDEMPLDGTPYATSISTMQDPAECVTQWSDDRQSIVTQSSSTMRDGTPVRVNVIRTLMRSNPYAPMPDLMTIQNVLLLPRRSVTVRLVYNRVS